MSEPETLYEYDALIVNGLTVRLPPVPDEEAADLAETAQSVLEELFASRGEDCSLWEAAVLVVHDLRSPMSSTELEGFDIVFYYEWDVGSS